MKRLFKIFVVSILALTLVGCGQQEVEEEKVLDGTKGDIIHTMFYAYGVNDAYLTDQIGDMIPTDGNEFLVVDIIVLNENEEDEVTMADTDFYLTYGSEEAVPLSQYGSDPLLEDELGREYTVDPASDKSGKLIFVVAADTTDFKLQAQDHYKASDSEEVVDGDVYSISFTAEKKEGE